MKDAYYKILNDLVIITILKSVFAIFFIIICGLSITVCSKTLV